jgi:hypothetical protein
MIKKRLETRQIELEERFCDICGKPAKGRHCLICERDLCNDHAIRKNEEWGGDHSDKYCIPCWDVGEPIRKRKQELTEIYEKELENLEEEWIRRAIHEIEVIEAR